MRVFRDLDMVEQLGSGVPRILESYPKECFRFMENFTRMTFPINDQVNDQANYNGITIDVNKLLKLLADLGEKGERKFLYEFKMLLNGK